MTNIRSVGIVGYGSFGAFIHELLKRFAPHVEVRVYSPGKEVNGQLFFSLEEVAKCDAVMLSVPIHAFEETLVQTLPHLSPDSIIVDVATVKLHTTEILKRLAGDRKYIATHPMFGPVSYKLRNKDIAGFRMVVTEYTVPTSLYEELKSSFKSLGFDIIEMSSDKHDKHVAETLFLTHFIGQVVSHAKFDRTEIDTVSFGCLMDAVETVKDDTELFRDVYRFNPHCREVLNRFQSGEHEARRILEETS